MNEQLKNNFSEETIDLVITAAYGSANLIDTLKVWFLLRKHDELKDLYNEYKSTANSVHSLHQEELPNYILDNLELKTGASLQENKGSFLMDFTSIFLAKPQLVFVATALVAAVLLSSILFQNHQVESKYSQAEIELANKQARETLLLVSKIFNTTQQTITEEIIPNRVVKPLNESLGYVNNLFKEGDI